MNTDMPKYWLIKCTRPGQEDLHGYTTSPTIMNRAALLRDVYVDVKWAVMVGSYAKVDNEKQIENLKGHDKDGRWIDVKGG